MTYDIDGWTSAYLLLAALGIGALVVAATAAARVIRACTIGAPGAAAHGTPGMPRDPS